MNLSDIYVGMNFLKNTFKAFVRHEKGTASIELLFTIPVLLLLFYGAVELSRYIIITQKMEKTVDEVGNIITQYNATTLTNAKMQALVTSIQYMMYPYYNPNYVGALPNIAVIITDVINTNASATTAPTPVAMWQACNYTVSPGGFVSKLTAGCTSNCNLTDASFGNAGFPTGASGFEANMTPNEEVVVTEAYYNYSPLTNYLPYLSNTIIYRTTSFVPRVGTLSTYSGGFPYTCQ